MLNDKGEIKNGIFFISMIVSATLFIFLPIIISDHYRVQRENETLLERIEEQSALIEYLEGNNG